MEAFVKPPRRPIYVTAQIQITSDQCAKQVQDMSVRMCAYVRVSLQDMTKKLADQLVATGAK